ncbi:MAG TPA: sulfatase [Armatimonadota bacterium]|nr:sulfatase [Armatimonadota bacterium]
MDRPNVIVMICHDIGQHLGCYGVETVSTPSLDGLAGEGVRFSNNFCTSPSCSPSRAAIFTGRYPHSNGVMGLCHNDFGWDLYPGEKHLAGLLHGAGYRTGLLGHQHETRRPHEMGYDDVKMGGHCGEVAEKSIPWLEDAAAGGQPFYGQIGFFEPHRPYDYGGATPDDSRGVTVPPWLVDEPSARDEFAGYQGAIRKVDAAMGEILAAVDRLGIRDNTVTIYTADHGMPFPRAKCSLYDPGIETPFIIRWPDGGWTGGRVQDELISNIDIVPTLLETLGIDGPDNIEGQSATGLLNGTEHAARDEIFAEMTYHDYCDPRRCIRTRTHKLIANFTTAPFFMNPSQTWRPGTITKDPVEPTYAYHPHVELYDLEADPLELSNVADDEARAEVADDLKARLLAWMEETDDPLRHGVPTPPHHVKAMEALRGG